MISVYDKKMNCCGCTACKHICPTNAIEMIEDSEGFLYPNINQKLCIDCGRCKRVCAFQNGYEKSGNKDYPSVYAVKNISEEIRKTSTSGGLFSAISDEILINNGVVFGAGFDENLNVIHSKAYNKQERDHFKGSKYVQSDLRDTYNEILLILEKGSKALFTGTPCQVAGLNSFLKMNISNTDNLVTCDIVCHGTPSPLIWREHIKFLEKRKGTQIEAYYCRPKIMGWHGHTEMAVYKNGSEDSKSLASQTYKKLFYSHNILRPACHNCIYTNINRPSDITMADFWGIERTMPEIDDNKGISLVLVNTEKGERLFTKTKGRIEYWESDIESCLQPQLQYPSKISEERNDFWKDYQTKGYIYVLRKYAGFNKKNATKNLIKNLLLSLGVLDGIRKIVSK